MGASATVHEGLIWLVGGVSTAVNIVGHRRRTPILNKVVCFDPILQRWCRKQGLKEPRAFCTALTLRHEIWVFGGLTTSPDCKVLYSLSSVAVFTPESGIWETSQISVQDCFAMASTKIGTHVYLIGGTEGSLKESTKHNYVYDWDNGKVWKEVSLPWPITGAVAQAIPLDYSKFLKGRYFKCMSEKKAKAAAAKTIQKHYRLKKQSRSDFTMEKGDLRQLKRTDSLKNLDASYPKWQISSSQQQIKTGQNVKHNNIELQKKREISYLPKKQVKINLPQESSQKQKSCDLSKKQEASYAERKGPSGSHDRKAKTQHDSYGKYQFSRRNELSSSVRQISSGSLRDGIKSQTCDQKKKAGFDSLKKHEILLPVVKPSSLDWRHESVQKTTEVRQKSSDSFKHDMPTADETSRPASPKDQVRTQVKERKNVFLKEQSRIDEIKKRSFESFGEQNISALSERWSLNSTRIQTDGLEKRQGSPDTSKKPNVYASKDLYLKKRYQDSSDVKLRINIPSWPPPISTMSSSSILMDVQRKPEANFLVKRHCDEPNFEKIGFQPLCSLVDPNLGMMTALEGNYKKTRKVVGLRSVNILPRFSYPVTKCDYIQWHSFPTILTLGGIDPRDPVNYSVEKCMLRYHPLNDSWKYFEMMPVPRCFHAAARLHGKVYVAGGYDPDHYCCGEMRASSATYMLDTQTGMWEEKAEMNSARAHHCLVTYKDHLYAFGGRDSKGRILRSVEVYSVQNDRWRPCSDMPSQRMGMAATVCNELIWLLGGVTCTGMADDPILDEVICYSPESNSWMDKSPLQYPRAYSSAVTVNREIFVCGGCVRSPSAKRSLVSVALIDSYDAENDAWRNRFEMERPRHCAAALAIGSCIYVIGGMCSQLWNPMSKNEVFCTESDRVLLPKPLPLNITGMAAVVIPPSDRNLIQVADFGSQIRHALGDKHCACKKPFVERVSDLETNIAK